MEKLVVYALGAYVLVQLLNKPAAGAVPAPVSTSRAQLPQGSMPATRAADETQRTIQTIAGAVGSVAQMISSIYQDAGSDPSAHADNSGDISFA